MKLKEVLLRAAQNFVPLSSGLILIESLPPKEKKRLIRIGQGYTFAELGSLVMLFNFVSESVKQNDPGIGLIGGFIYLLGKLAMSESARIINSKRKSRN